MKKIIKNSLVVSLILTLAIILMFGNAPKAEAITTYFGSPVYNASDRSLTFDHNTENNSSVHLEAYSQKLVTYPGSDEQADPNEVNDKKDLKVYGELIELEDTGGMTKKHTVYITSEFLKKVRENTTEESVYIYVTNYRAVDGKADKSFVVAGNTAFSLKPSAALDKTDAMSLYKGENFTSGEYTITLTNAAFNGGTVTASDLNAWAKLPEGLSYIVKNASGSTVTFAISGTAEELTTQPQTLTFNIPADATNAGEAINAGSISYTIADPADRDADKWYQDNKAIVDKADQNKITLADKAAIDKAIKEYAALSPDAKAKAKDKHDKLLRVQEAYNWTLKHNDIITATTVDANNEAALTAALDELTDGIKANIPETVLNDLNNKKVVIDGLFKQDFSDTLKKDADAFTPADLEDLQKAVEAYDNLTGAQQNLVDDITKAKIESARNATKWLNDNAGILNEKTVDENNLDAINKALEEYNRLDEKDKKLIDPAYLKDLQNKKTAAEWADKYKDVLNKNPDELTADDIAKLNEARTEYNAFGNDVKTLLDASKLSTMIDVKANEFIKKYVSDASGTIYKTATKDNYKQILSGKAEWDKLTQAEKDAINKKLLENGGKTYEELLKMAEAIEKELNAKNGAETGDATNVMLWFVLLVMSMSVIATEMNKRKELR